MMKKANRYVVCINALLLVIMAVIQWFVWNLSTVEGYFILAHTIFKIMIGIIVVALISLYARIKYHQFQYSLAIIPCMGAFFSLFNYYNLCFWIDGDIIEPNSPIQQFMGQLYVVSLLFAMVVLILECKYPHMLVRSGIFLVKRVKNIKIIAIILLYIIAFGCFFVSVEGIDDSGIRFDNMFMLYTGCLSVFTAMSLKKKSSRE